MNKNIIIAGAIAVGLYLFSRTKKIIQMTPAQKTARQAKVLHTLAHMTHAETKRVLEEARRQKARSEGTSEQKIRLTPMEMMLALRAQAKEKIFKEEQGMGFDYVRERAPMNKAIHIHSKKIIQKIMSGGTSAIRKRIVEKIKHKQAQKTREQKAAEQRAVRLYAAKIRAQTAAKQKAAAARKAAHNPYHLSFPATGPKNIVHITPTRQKIAQKIAKRIVKKAVAHWKAPLIRSPKRKSRLIIPSGRLRKLVKKEIARKKAVQQKTTQKTTPHILSARRKKRLQALYGSHWHQIWIQRPRQK